MNFSLIFKTPHHLFAMDAATIILGFTGYIGSGCSFIANRIPNISDGNLSYEYFKLSDIIREHIKPGENNNIDSMQNIGNDLRKNNNSPGFLAGELIKKIDQKNLPEKTAIIIDGIKNSGEVKTFREFPNFFLFSVQSSTEIRQKRCLDVNRFKEEEDFSAADKRDLFEDNIFGQQVKKCNYLSDIIILNEDSYTDADEKGKTDFTRIIYDSYIKIIENLCSGEKKTPISPTVDEIAMATAYAYSKKSSCIKRKVGAVIIDSLQSCNPKTETGIVSSIPFTVSTGFNEVPLGSYQCVHHPDFQMCYRDYLQEKHAQKIKYCPNCGTKINIEIVCSTCGEKYNNFKKRCSSCKNEIDFDLKCEDCGIDIFREHLPGEKETPGKLLDMCRALHAEENALLNLISSGNSKIRNLTMYVTTQPCNLCANKIVSAGIKKVVYDEPYPMKEANEILRNGGIDVKRFKGVKSSAFFKFYNNQ